MTILIFFCINIQSHIDISRFQWYPSERECSIFIIDRVYILTYCLLLLSVYVYVDLRTSGRAKKTHTVRKAVRRVAKKTRTVQKGMYSKWQWLADDMLYRECTAYRTMIPVQHYGVLIPILLSRMYGHRITSTVLSWNSFLSLGFSLT